MSLSEHPYLAKSVVESPVGLVVVKTAAHRNAMTISFFSEVAHHPTSMWVSIARSSWTHALLEEAGQFSFILLHQGQAEIARFCGTVSGRERDKCAGLDLYESDGGFLFLRDALTSTACRVTRAVPVGDHTLFIANMLAGDVETRHLLARQLLQSDLAA